MKTFMRTLRVWAHAIPEKVVPLAIGQYIGGRQCNFTHKSMAIKILRSGSLVAFLVSCLLRLDLGVGDSAGFIEVVGFFGSLGFLDFVGAVVVVDAFSRDVVMQFARSGHFK